MQRGALWCPKLPSLNHLDLVACLPLCNHLPRCIGPSPYDPLILLTRLPPPPSSFLALRSSGPHLLSPANWEPTALALHSLGHRGRTAFALLADHGSGTPRPSWGPERLVRLLEVYGDCALPHQALMASLARCLVLNVSSLKPDQVVRAARALADLTSGPLSGTASPAAASRAPPPSLPSPEFKAVAFRGSPPSQGQPAEEAAAGSAAGSAAETAGSAARSPWSLQLYRALALQAHQSAADLSLEQLMQLLGSSLRAGACHSLLFRDVVRR